MNGRATLVGLITCLVLGAAVSIALGPDSSWDFQQYHVYNGFALLEWRYDKDLFAAEIQTYHNPLIEVPFYVALRWFGHTAASATLGLFFGLLVFLAFGLNRTVLTATIQSLRLKGAYPLALALAATAIGVTGVATGSQIGLSSNEIQTACLVVGGLWMLSWTASETGSKDANPFHFLLAGALFGAAVALKLTAALASPGAVIAILVANGLWPGIRRSALFCAGWALAVALLWGWWAIMLQRHFQSPVFPYFNNIFQSPWYPPIRFVDDRFGPQDFWSGLTFPFQWAMGNASRISELPLRDPRIAAGLLSLALLFVLHLAKGRLPPSLQIAMVWGLVTYGCWQGMFAIIRYAVPLEISAGGAIVAVIVMVSGHLGLEGRRTVVLTGVVLLSLMLATIYPNWGRGSVGDRFESEQIPLERGSLVILLGVPTAYLAPLLSGPQVAFVGIAQSMLNADDSRLAKQIRRRIRRHNGPLYVVDVSGSFPWLVGLPARFGFHFNQEDCHPISSSIPALAPAKLCLAERTARASLP